MRRNFNSGHRGGPQQNWQSSPRMSGGRPPMVADLGLQDIDKELELLQRKREIIEQQQQILSSEFRGRNEYEESYDQSSRFDNFAQSFNDRRAYNPPSRKRPIPVWEDDIPNKRFSGPERTRNRPAPPPLMRSGPVYNQQLRPVRPQSGPFRPKPKRSPPPPRTVRAPAPPPSRPKPYERKRAPEPAQAPDNLPPGELNRLCPDREPTKQVRGRLELALGWIIKQIRADGGAEKLKFPAIVRDVKSVVRDRIRDIMMGQVIGTSDSIIARYREVYGKETDIELVDNAVQAQTGDVAPFKIDDPEKYFKVNMQRLMQLKIKRLLDQVEEAARAEYGKDNETKDESVTETDATTEKIPDAAEIEAEKNPLDPTITSTETFKNLEKWMTGRMGSLIKKYLPNIVRLMDIDTKYTRLKNMITSETVKMLVGKSDKQISDMIEGASGSPKQKSPYKPLPHYAKLLGRPGLPKRNQMEQFFEKYNPKSIKKHRTVHNLLFVGFTEKDDFERFLTADGTVIGKYTLSIRCSDKARTEQNGKEAVANTSVSSISSEDKLIGSELDEQITNLLSSIRSEEENGNSVNAEEDEVKTDENDLKTEESDIKTEDSDVKNDENNIKTDENDAKTDENDVITEGNDEGEENFDDTIEENDDADANMEENADAEMGLADDNSTADADATINITESNGATETSSEDKQEEMEEADQVKPLVDDKSAGRTPSRTSNRLAATPGRVQTRRASRLAQNDS